MTLPEALYIYVIMLGYSIPMTTLLVFFAKVNKAKKAKILLIGVPIVIGIVSAALGILLYCFKNDVQVGLFAWILLIGSWSFSGIEKLIKKL